MATLHSVTREFVPPPRPLAAEEEENPPASLPMYLAGLIVTLCGLCAISLILDDVDVSNLTMGLAIIGTTVSYLSRKQNIAPHSIVMPAAILCLFLAMLAFVSDQVLPFLGPAGVAEDRQKGLAVLLTWIVVFRSFTLVTDGSLLFCCVFTLAMTGLVG